MRTSIIGWLVAATAIASTACSGDSTSISGPPEIKQVLVRERVATHDDMGNGVIEILPRLAFGDHPDIPTKDDDRKVTAAVAKDGQRIRIVVDKLLKGNQLEEVPCADGTWSKVPDGMDYNGVARCAGADLSRCQGLCIAPDGHPIGILDKNQDGAIDATRLIDGAVVLTCNGAVVPLDPLRSYYQPTGTQLIPSSGVEALGPAIAIVTADGMPPNATCGIMFAGNVVGKDGDRMCAPGAAGCTAGDTAAISFSVEPFLMTSTEPADGDTDVELADPMSGDATVLVHTNAPLDAANLATAVTVTANGTAVTGLTPAISSDDDATVSITFTGGFQSATTYAVTVTSGAAGVTDTYADALAADATITWTTK